MVRQTLLLFAFAAALVSAALFLSNAYADVPCDKDARQCTYPLPGGWDCCHQITSFPEAIAHNPESGRANWTNLAGGTKCGVKWVSKLLIPCTWPNGDVCGDNQASPDCT